MRSMKEMFVLTDKGSKDLKKAIASSVFMDLSLMIPLGLLFLVIIELLNKAFGNPYSELNVYIYTGIALVLVGVMYLAHYLQYNTSYVSAYNESANRRISIAESLRKLPLSFFGKKDLSDLTTRVMNDATEIEHTFSHTVPGLFGSTIALVLVAISLTIYDWRLSLSLFACLPISMLLIFGTRKWQYRQSQKAIGISLAATDGIQETLEGIRVIKGYGMDEKVLKGLRKKFDDVYKASLSAELKIGLVVSAGSTVLRIGMALVVLVGTYLLTEGSLDVIKLVLFLMIASKVYDPLTLQLMRVAEVFHSMVRLQRMKEINDYPKQEGAEVCDTNGYDIEFKDVKFSYNDEEILHGISFTAKQGEVTALVGPSGSGKSTVTRLAARFWDVEKGEITIGGVDVNGVDPETLLKNYAIVFQDVLLFNDTVMNNIRIGKEGATDEEVMNAARIAQCDHFVNRLANGYETMIGENGHTLSGGERQRISIARALLKDAPVILLDEATASLDVENETKVQDAISELIKNKTVVVIAHRMRTVAGADKIVVLKEGNIVEEGTHDDLISKDGVYSKMVNTQKENAKWEISS